MLKKSCSLRSSNYLKTDMMKQPFKFKSEYLLRNGPFSRKVARSEKYYDFCEKNVQFK